MNQDDYQDDYQDDMHLAPPTAQSHLSYMEDTDKGMTPEILQVSKELKALADEIDQIAANTQALEGWSAYSAITQTVHTAKRRASECMSLTKKTTWPLFSSLWKTAESLNNHLKTRLSPEKIQASIDSRDKKSHHEILLEAQQACLDMQVTKKEDESRDLQTNMSIVNFIPRPFSFNDSASLVPALNRLLIAQNGGSPLHIVTAMLLTQAPHLAYVLETEKEDDVKDITLNIAALIREMDQDAKRKAVQQKGRRFSCAAVCINSQSNSTAQPDLKRRLSGGIILNVKQAVTAALVHDRTVTPHPHHAAGEVASNELPLHQRKANISHYV